jgi:hypothetical protein
VSALGGRQGESGAPDKRFFFTVDLLERRKILLLVDRIVCLREAVAATWQGHTFLVLNCWTAPDGGIVNCRKSAISDTVVDDGA